MTQEQYKVLVVEDDEVDRMAFCRMVKGQSLSYKYKLAGSVAEAGRLLDQDNFDAAVVDYLLGDGTAFDILGYMKNTPAIFITGAGNEELAVKAMKAGAYDYLIKDATRSYLKILPQVITKTVKHRRTELKLKRHYDNLEQLVKERTEQLASEKELMSATLAGMSDAVIVVDEKERILLLNKVAETLTGWKLDEIRHKSFEEVVGIIDESTGLPAAKYLQQAFESGRQSQGTDRDLLLGKNRKEHPVSIDTSPIKDNNGNITGAVMVIRDVAREREVERMKADFISSVSHELRTPLTSIKAYTETILRDREMNEDTKREFLVIIDEESDRLAKLIQELLEISRIESGTFHIAPRKIRPAVIINRVAGALRPVAMKKGVNLNTILENQLSDLWVDQSKFESIVTNLAGNALKFTPPGGSVKIKALNRKDEFVLEVKDTGVGIPKEALPKIFQRFYRDQHSARKTQGTGLGLAIVKEIVDRHNGRIEVQSELNRGTTFRIFLPGLKMTKTRPHSKAKAE